MATNPARLAPDIRREHLLVAARRLFAERGFSAVSMSDIATEAGVARGLVNHYFGTKRDLFLEVVKGMMREGPPIAEKDRTRDAREVWSDAVDRWLDNIEANRETWFAALGSEGFGSDPEIEAIVEASRDHTVDRIIENAGLKKTREMRALMRIYGDMAEGATREWLRRGRLTREQVHHLLVDSFFHLIEHTTNRSAPR